MVTASRQQRSTSAALDIVDHHVLLRLEFLVVETPLNWLQSCFKGRTQFVKMGQHQSQATGVDVGVPRRSVLGPLLFAIYCSPIANVIAHHGDDTPRHLAMRADNITYPPGCPFSLRV